MGEYEDRMIGIQHEEKIINLRLECDMIFFEKMRPKLFKDGDQWCCLFGEDIQSGVCGFGKTPFEAIEGFNRSMHKA